MLIKPRESWFSPKCIEVQRRMLTGGGRALNRLGGTPASQTYADSGHGPVKCGSETAGDKLRRREGNSPDQQLKCLNAAQWKGCGTTETVRMLA